LSWVMPPVRDVLAQVKGLARFDRSSPVLGTGDQKLKRLRRQLELFSWRSGGVAGARAWTGRLHRPSEGRHQGRHDVRLSEEHVPKRADESVGREHRRSTLRGTGSAGTDGGSCYWRG